MFEIASTGTLSARSYGGPLWNMGTVVNRESRTVETWQGYYDSALHGELCRTLAQAGFPWPRARFNPLPDERNSAVLVRRRVGVQRMMPIVTRFLPVSMTLGEDAQPLLFETRIAGGWLDGQGERFPTLESATAGHQSWVARVRTFEEENELPPPGGGW